MINWKDAEEIRKNVGKRSYNNFWKKFMNNLPLYLYMAGSVLFFLGSLITLLRNNQ